MNWHQLHLWWARHRWQAVLLAVTVLALARAYMMWRQLPGDTRTSI